MPGLQQCRQFFDAMPILRFNYADGPGLNTEPNRIGAAAMWTLILAYFEAGTWFGWFAAKFGSRERVRERLINGTRAATAFPVIDKHLERETRKANNMQRKTAAGITRGIRFFAGTRACELAILKMIQSKWPGAKQEEVEVKLHL
jgi:hypothetical protein